MEIDRDGALAWGREMLWCIIYWCWWHLCTRHLHAPLSWHHVSVHTWPAGLPGLWAACQHIPQCMTVNKLSSWIDQDARLAPCLASLLHLKLHSIDAEQASLELVHFTLTSTPRLKSRDEEFLDWTNCRASRSQLRGSLECNYSLFTPRNARSPLRINGERAFLRVNRL